MHSCAHDITPPPCIAECERETVLINPPRVRIQSCRASFSPYNTGYPTTLDNCDPESMLNPFWAPDGEIIGGRMSHTDTGDTTGCEQSFEREFLVQDRVCNAMMTTHTIESCAFNFEPSNDGSGTTFYDASTLLPTFVYQDNGNGANQEYSNDILSYVVLDESTGTTTSFPVSQCKTHAWEYLDTSLTNAVWTAIEANESGGVADLDNQDSYFWLQINQNRMPLFRNIVDNFGGMFKEGVGGMSRARRLNASVFQCCAGLCSFGTRRGGCGRCLIIMRGERRQQTKKKRKKCMMVHGRGGRKQKKMMPSIPAFARIHTNKNKHGRRY